MRRLDDPDKTWKASRADAEERGYWGDYRRAYEHALSATSVAAAPWHVVPADHKWFTHLAVAEAIISSLEDLDLSFPKLDAEKRKDLKKARAALRRES